MDRTFLIYELKKLLKEQKEGKNGTSIYFKKMSDIVKTLRTGTINDNFKGTLQEIHIYVNDGQFHPNPYSHISHHKLNISRWVEELEMLESGGGAVTIDYDDRKGREI
ncbi:YtzH-like family protein [Evansella tamaricis]|uniref:YtzH-like family protein n=1 Tax=Evansella tamaricis TaxID=2069301 RepID=A0ABS6JJB9_9BACI|nr:YtzH-like family protein [Evansella tamaricis]MBU9713736.1 YtzH-like family protein [Evansella tamaricis]